MDDLSTTTTSIDVCLSPELGEAIGNVLREGEALQEFVEHAIRYAVEARRRREDDFRARGEASWADFQRTSITYPVGEVLDEMRALTVCRRQQLGL
jgi:hypothetical protein